MSEALSKDGSEQPRGAGERVEDDRVGPGALRALSGGADAVLLVGLAEQDRALRIEIANVAAQALFGVTAAPGAWLDEAAAPELAPLVARLRDGATRERTTREQVVLQPAGGVRIVVDVQVEPLPDAPDGERRVLAVVRLADAEVEPPPAPTAPVVGVFRTELGLGAVFVDEPLLGLLGISHEQALGQGWLDAIHPDDRGAVSSALDDAATDDAVQMDCRVLRGGAEERLARLRAVPVRGDDGHPTGYLASLEDLTDERRDREAGAGLAELAEVLDEWIAIASPDLQLRYANPSARRGLALPELDELQKVSVVDFVPVDEHTAVARDVADAIEAEGQWTGELRLVALDGREIDLDGTIVAHYGPTGAVAHYSLLGRDVSAVRAAQRALRDSEERFRLIAESSPTGIYFVGQGGLISYANAVLTEMLGESSERIIGRAFLEFIHPDDVPGVVESGSLVAGQPEGTTIESRIRRPSGEIRWVKAQGAPVIDSDGVLRGYVGSIIDVTDELAAKRELEMLGRAVEATPDLVSFHDVEGRMFFANAAAREFLGLGPDDPVPPLEPDAYVDAPEEAFDEILEALISRGQWNGEFDIFAEGRRMPASIGVVAHRDENGEIEYFSSLSRDLTAQRRVEAARRRSEAVLRAIVQASPLAIFALDAEGRVHVWNHASEELFGWSASEVVGSTPPFVSDENRDDIETLTTRVFAGHTVKGHRLRYTRRDGEIVDADVAIAPLRNAEERVVTAVAIIADVTEQTRATEALVESEVWFRSLVQHSSDMVLVVSAGAEILYASPSAREFGAVGIDGVFPARVDDVVRALDPDLEPLRPLFARLRATPGATERTVFRAHRADGAFRWVEIAATNLLDVPAVQGIVVNAHDVTESFEAEAAVRDSEERLRAMLSGVSDAITVIDGEGSITYASPVAGEMFADVGSDEAESIFSTVDPEDLSRSLELWEQIRATPGEAPAAEVRIRRRDGSLIDAEVIANNLLDDPAVQGIVMTIRNITERKRTERRLLTSDARLRESEARYRAVVDDQIELVCRYLPDTTITFVNKAFAQFYGRRADDLVGSLLIDLHPPSERRQELQRLSSFGPGAEVQIYDDWELGGDGVRRWYRWTDRAFLTAEGKIIEFQSVGHDVTEEHRASVLSMNQADILEQIARGVPLDETLAAIAGTVEAHFPQLSCAVFRLDTTDPELPTLRLGAASHLPRQFAAELDGIEVAPKAGSSAAAVLSRTAVFVTDASSDEEWSAIKDIAIEHGIRAAWSTPVLGSDGRTVLGTVDGYSRDRIEPDAEHRRIFSLVAHLTSIAIERKEFEDRLAHESMHDPLTSLPNRLLFLDRLALAVARGHRTRTGIAVLFLDLDRFKNVNDSLGHDAGDELLVSVSQRLESVLRPGDTVARFGGDEFTILCEDLPHESSRDRALEIAQRLLSSVSRPFVVRNAETFVGVSIGIALTATGEETPDELLRDADAAMYHAKDSGRGRAEVFDDTMRARAMACHATENALHHAIERGELRLFFQPIVRLEDARCIGAEALVRWQHPERGLVLPAEFIPLAEETGLVVPLGEWVLEQAATQAARWQLEQDGDFVVAINLSARQVGEPDLADRVVEVIERTGVRPSNLCFEITETVLMQDADAVMHMIEHVRALGVRFAIDDFGTGYSSLGYLKRFSVDTVKIDRAFIDGLADDDGDRAIVSAVIGLAHALGLRVVAEGVEREAQLAELIALGCDEAQGYFFAPPQPADDLRGLISRTRRWRPPGSPLMGRS